VSRLRFGKPWTTKKGGKYIPLRYVPADGKSEVPLRLQTPNCRTPFGVKADSMGETPEQQSPMAMNVAFDNLDTNREMSRFREVINQIDAAVIAEATKHATVYFGGATPPTAEIIKFNFRSTIKLPKEPNTAGYPPMMKLKVPIQDGNVRLQVFEQREESAIEAISPNSKVTTIVSPAIWVVNSQFGVTYLALQSRVEGTQEGGYAALSEYAIRDSSEEVRV